MDNQSGWLVDDDKRLVLEHHRKIDRFRRKRQFFFRLLWPYHNGFIADHILSGHSWLAIDRNMSVGNPLLDTASRISGKPSGKNLVQPLTSFFQ